MADALRAKIDINERGCNNPTYRSRMVAKEIRAQNKMLDDLFAATYASTEGFQFLG